MKNLFKMRIKEIHRNKGYNSFLFTREFSFKNYIDKNQIDKIMPYSDIDSVNYSSFNSPLSETFVYTDLVKNKFSLVYVNLENILDVRFFLKL